MKRAGSPETLQQNGLYRTPEKRRAPWGKPLGHDPRHWDTDELCAYLRGQSFGREQLQGPGQTTISMAEQPEAAKEKPSFKLLGFLDVQNTPCARESILYGSLGSLVVGLGHFLATSRVRRSCDVAVGGFILTSFGCWMYCRVHNAKLRMQQKIIQEGIRNKILYEGSSLDPERKQKSGEQGSSAQN